MEKRFFKEDDKSSIPEDAIRARLERDGKTFEILVKIDEFEKYRQGKLKDVNQVLFTSEIFKDISTAERPSAEDLKAVFNTADHTIVCETILKKGEFQLTTEQRKKMQESKKKQIIAHIAKMAKDPRTDAPHPPARIENAMNEAKINVDPIKHVEEQIKEVVNKLKPVLPLSFEKKTIVVRIPSAYTGKCYGLVKEMADLQTEEWQSDALYMKVEIPAGIEPELLDKLGKATQGEAEVKEMK